jgi:tetratricopeptide (TPR) repeat protein
MSVNFKLFLLILSLFIFISFCSSSQGERERGIRFASSGQWDKAIELLEKYVKSNIQVMSKLKGIDKSGISDKDKAQIRDFLEALLYLLGSYLGKAGFDERKIIDYVIQMKDVDPNEADKLSKIVIQIFDFLKLDYPQALSTIYKAQRLYESIMYGKEKFLDSDEGNSQLENLGEFQTDPSKDKVLHEIKRLINSIEFLGGKILIWKVVLESKMLGHPDYYAKPQRPKNEPLPSLCLILDENDPFLKKNEDVKSMAREMVAGVMLLSYGSSEELFKQQGENYKNIIINDLLKNFQGKITPTCNNVKYYENFYNQFSKTITQTFQEKLTGFQGKITGITVYPESITPNPDPETGVYICPRKKLEEFFEDFRDFFMCGFQKDVPGKAEEIKKDIQFFPRNATSQIVFIEPDGNKDCEGNEIKDSNRLLTLQFFFSDEVTSGEAQMIREQICNSKNFKELFDEFGNFVSSLTKPLNEVQFKSESNFPDPTTLPEKYLKDILEQREDPKFWKDIK